MKTNVRSYGVVVDGAVIPWDVLEAALRGLVAATNADGVVAFTDTVKGCDTFSSYTGPLAADLADRVKLIVLAAKHREGPRQFIDMTDPRVG